MTHRLSLFARILFATLALPAMAGEVRPIHGLWVWKGPAILGAPQGAERLRDFCRAQNINEVYVSVFTHGELADIDALTATIELLHRSNVRVEALLSSTDADEAGTKHRDKLLDQVRAIMKFNQQHRGSRIDGIHLDIEPQQRSENKGAGNLRFLPGLAAAYRAVRALAEPAGLTVNADIQNKLLKGSADERRTLLQSLPRLTLMLYELEKGKDGSFEQKAATLRVASRRFLDMAYDGLHDSGLAQMVIGLRTPDYGELLPSMLEVLNEANGDSTHYLGWARHSYNDVAEGGGNAPRNRAQPPDRDAR
jgi:hypothetical protein